MGSEDTRKGSRPFRSDSPAPEEETWGTGAETPIPSDEGRRGYP